MTATDDKARWQRLTTRPEAGSLRPASEQGDPVAARTRGDAVTFRNQGDCEAPGQRGGSPAATPGTSASARPPAPDAARSGSPGTAGGAAGAGGAGRGAAGGAAGAGGAGRAGVGRTIAELGEFGLIAAMAARMPQPPGTLVGIGDDAAVFLAAGARVVATTDLLVEGSHFRRDWSGPADVGVKAAARNLADLAAMGAQPQALLVALAAPRDLPVAWALDVASGLAGEAARAGAAVLGGDLSEAAQIVLAVTALGVMTAGDPVTRSGARPGDVLAVTGRLGYSAAGQALLEAGLEQPADAVAAHRRPCPPYAAGPEAASYGANSMIDISDGLVQDLGHIAAASRVRIDIETARLTAGPPVITAAKALRLDPEAAPKAWMLGGGEDHALAASFPPDAPLPPGWAIIGHVRQGSGIRVDGKSYRGITGWKHFG